MVSLKKPFNTLKGEMLADISNVPIALDQSYLPGLDGLRGISIIIVVASHFERLTPFTEYFYGDLGVEIFFVISGFLITSLLLKEKVKRGSVSFKNFYIRRILRIVPVSYLFLIILFILNSWFQLGISFKSFIISFLYVKNIPFNYLSDWYTGHFWSLSVEEQFYICFPFFIVTKTNKFIISAVAIILIVPLLNILGFNNVGIFYSNHIVHFITFIIIILLSKGTTSILVGSLYAILLFKKVIVVDKLRSNFFMSFGLLIFSFLILPGISYFNIPYLSVILFPVIIGYVILLNLKEKNLLRHLLDSTILKKIGILSYSIYIWQQLFTGPQKLNLFKYSDSIVVRSILLLIVSYISYYCYEKLFLRYKAKFKSI